MHTSTDCEHSRRYYNFFDTSVALAVPQDLQKKWDLLYGNFATEGDACSDPIDLVLRDAGGGMLDLSVGPIERKLPVETALIHLQDVVQNHLLSSVTSHCLFHGACWSVNDRGVMILAESGVGKSTLSLSRWNEDGNILSDEIAAWASDEEVLHAFPRALAVRPESLSLCGIEETYPLLTLDEEKVIVPLPASSKDAKVPLSVLIVLEGEPDRTIGEGQFCELSVASENDGWIEAMKLHDPDVEIAVHPDGNNWWRCRTSEPLKASGLHDTINRGGAVLTGFHQGAYRTPTYEGLPAIERIDQSKAAEIALSHLINARTLAEKVSPIRLMGQVRTMLQSVQCFRCIPGKLAETVNALEKLVMGNQ